MQIIKYSKYLPTCLNILMKTYYYTKHKIIRAVAKH